MSAKVFIDTNILLYARDSSEPVKQPIAEAVLRRLWADRNGRLSVQVLNEYYVNVTRKLDPGLTEQEAWADVEALNAWQPLSIDFALLADAQGVQQRWKLSWWDSLIVAAAGILDCEQILSEDLSHDQDYHGIQVIDPFAA